MRSIFCNVELKIYLTMISKAPGGLISTKALIPGMRLWNKKPILYHYHWSRRRIKASLCGSDVASPPWAQPTLFEIHVHFLQVSEIGQLYWFTAILVSS
jgi:hypothetical protein